MMKTSKFQTFMTLGLILYQTGLTSLRAVLRTLSNRISRGWVDQEVLQWSRRVIQLLQLQYTIINPKQIKPTPGQPTIVMCNHSSLFDIPLSFLPFQNCSIRMLAKKELTNIPLFGRAILCSGFPVVNRHNRVEAMKSLEATKALMEDGIILWIYPEGTRSKNGKLGPFKKGGFITAIQAKATIIPIGIRGAHNILPARTSQLSLGQHAEIHVGEPIDATNYTLENKDALIADVHDVMRRLVGEG